MDGADQCLGADAPSRASPYQHALGLVHMPSDVCFLCLCLFDHRTMIPAADGSRAAAASRSIEKLYSQTLPGGGGSYRKPGRHAHDASRFR